MDWDSYAATSDPYLTIIFQFSGALMMLLGLMALWLRPCHRISSHAMLLGFLLLVLHQFAAWSEKDFQIGMLLELCLQAIAPLLLWLRLRGVESSKLVLSVSIAAAATFIGHGLYAASYHPQPADFVTMTMKILRVSESGAQSFLHVAGWLDFLVAGLIFVPVQKVRIGALGYMVFWGGVTALARLVANYSPVLAFHGLDPWIAEMLVRTAHWALPLWLLLHAIRTRKPDDFSKSLQV